MPAVHGVHDGAGAGTVPLRRPPADVRRGRPRAARQLPPPCRAASPALQGARRPVPLLAQRPFLRVRHGQARAGASSPPRAPLPSSCPMHPMHRGEWCTGGSSGDRQTRLNGSKGCEPAPRTSSALAVAACMHLPREVASASRADARSLPGVPGVNWPKGPTPLCRQNATTANCPHENSAVSGLC